MNNGSYVFFIGDVALDEYYSADYFPKIKEKIIVHTLPSQMGGMIANAACVYSNYEKNAKFLAALNNGDITKRLCENLNENGLDTSHIIIDNSLPDSKTIIILAENEHTVFIPTMNLQKLEVNEETLQAIYDAKYIYSNFCEIRPLCSGELNSYQILKQAKENGVKLWCDLDVADISPEEDCLFECVDTLFLNEIGFNNIKGNRSDEETRRDYLFHKGINMLVVTYAEKGCHIFKRDMNFHVDGIDVQVVDVTGAGDTFCSSFLYAFEKTEDIKLAAEFANYAAARSVMFMGARAGASGIDNVLEFIKEYDSDYKRFEVLR